MDPVLRFKDKILLFSDGGSKGNPGPGGWGVVIVEPAGQVVELGAGDRHTTNNRMEMSGVIGGLRHLRKTAGEVAVLTDSTYVIRGIQQWIEGWIRRGWRTASGGEVKNELLWKDLHHLVRDREQRYGKMSWHYTRGHTGIPGNERVDAIAEAKALGKRITLYKGSLLKYDVPVYDLPEDTSLPEPRDDWRKKAGKKAKAFAYLSLVGGEFQTHPDWKSCEARVKGRPGARFKKAMTEADVRKIRREWGLE